MKHSTKRKRSTHSKSDSPALRTPTNGASRKKGRVAIIVIIAGILVYWNSFSGVFLLDDNGRIVGNNAIQKLLPISIHLKTSRPLVTLSLAMNYGFGKLQPWGYHLFNLTVHLIAGLALFGIIHRTLSLDAFREKFARSAHWFALAVAVLWVVHPLQTQSVTYTIQRAESMMGMFYLLTLYCVIRGATGARRQGLWYLSAVITCASGMGCKAVMITAPFMVLLFDRTFLERSMAAVIRRRWALYIGLFTCWVILFTHGVAGRILRPGTTKSTTVGFELQDVSAWEYAMTQSQVILHYLRLSFWPTGQALDYGWPMVRTLREAIVSGGVVLLLLTGTLFAFFKKPWLGFAGAWFFVILSPTSSFIPIKDPIYEHRMYLSLAALVVLAVAVGYWAVISGLKRLSPNPIHHRMVLAGLVVIAASSLGYATLCRNSVYQSRQAMWSDVLAKRPDNARAHTNLGLALFEQGNVDEAVRRYQRALELKPDLRQARSNLQAVKNRFFIRALDLAQAGQKTEALRLYRKAQQAVPEDIQVNINLANILASFERHEEAEIELRQALMIAPPDTDLTLLARAHFNLGNILNKQRKRTEAIEQYRMAVAVDPNYHNAYYGLGFVLEQNGLLDEAIEAYRAVLAIKPNHANAQKALDAVLLRRAKGRDR
ncbi:MAG: tetratricopeptide repeat protein [Phycisphaerales bacterium]|nr:tetratricopeptide repeat protein [Phycisphaerales bacterium]